MKSYGKYFPLLTLLSVLLTLLIVNRAYATNKPLRESKVNAGSIYMTSEVTIVVDPETTTVDSGQAFSVSVVVNAGAQEIDGASAYLDFDKDVIQIVSMTPGSSFQFEIQNSFDNDAGTIDFAAGSFNNFPSGTITLVEIEFEAIAPTAGSILAFQFTDPRQTYVASDGASLLTDHTDGTIIVNTTRAINLAIGWNKVALPLSLVTPLTAEALCEQIAEQGGSIAEIDRWHNGGWDGHTCGYPFNNFELELGVGYFIKANTASSFSITGSFVSTPVALDLQIGWNSISVPHTDAYSAESLCDEIISQGVSALEIDRWDAGGWDGYICGYPFNDFPIERDKGYFVKSTSSGTVTPDAPLLRIEN